MNTSEIEKIEEWILPFHGVTYIINVISSDVMLTLEIEDEITGERWSSEFTSQYIEETTHKAGNFKKFSVFCKMLNSAFAKTNESVFMDILTFADLELLKAKKAGGNNESTATSFVNSSKGDFSMKNKIKRYAILTYTGEFDRVHYPLPLAYEEKPNVLALQRTIKRLRKELQEKHEKDLEPTSEKEKELRQIVAQLRQENTEIKHRLRQTTSRSHIKQIPSSPLSSSLATANNDSMLSTTTHSNAELVQANQKLRKQVEQLKKELADSSQYIEHLKMETNKEIAKWKLKIDPSYAKQQQTLNIEHKQDIRTIAELKKRLLLVERELKLEKLSKGVAVGSNNRPSSNSRGVNHTNNWIPSSSSSFGSSRRSMSNPRDNYQSSSSHKPTITRSNSPIIKPARDTTKSGYSRNGNNQTTNRGSSRSSSRGSNRSPSPNHISSPSSSLGRQFDPTAYQRAQSEKYQQLHASRGRNQTPTPSTTSTYDHYYQQHHTSNNNKQKKASSNRYDSPNSVKSSQSQTSQGSQRSKGSKRDESPSFTTQNNTSKSTKNTQKTTSKPIQKPSHSTQSSSTMIKSEIKPKEKSIKHEKPSTIIASLLGTSTTNELISPEDKPKIHTKHKKYALHEMAANKMNISSDVFLTKQPQETKSMDTKPLVSNNINSSNSYFTPVELKPTDRKPVEDKPVDRTNTITSNNNSNNNNNNIPEKKILNLTSSKEFLTSNNMISSKEFHTTNKSTEHSFVRSSIDSLRSSLDRTNDSINQSILSQTNDINDIDKRIQDLQEYLNNARMGIQEVKK